MFLLLLLNTDPELLKGLNTSLSLLEATAVYSTNDPLFAMVLGDQLYTRGWQAKLSQQDTATKYMNSALANYKIALENPLVSERLVLRIGWATTIAGPTKEFIDLALSLLKEHDSAEARSLVGDAMLQPPILDIEGGLTQLDLAAKSPNSIYDSYAAAWNWEIGDSNSDTIDPSLYDLTGLFYVNNEFSKKGPQMLINRYLDRGQTEYASKLWLHLRSWAIDHNEGSFAPTENVLDMIEISAWLAGNGHTDLSIELLNSVPKSEEVRQMCYFEKFWPKYKISDEWYKACL